MQRAPWRFSERDGADVMAVARPPLAAMPRSMTDINSSSTLKPTSPQPHEMQAAVSQPSVCTPPLQSPRIVSAFAFADAEDDWGERSPYVYHPRLWWNSS